MLAQKSPTGFCQSQSIYVSCEHVLIKCVHIQHSLPSTG